MFYEAFKGGVLQQSLLLSEPGFSLLKVIILGLLFASRIDLVTLFLNALYLLRSSVL